MKVRVKIDNEVYEVEIADLGSRPILATVDGETFEVWPEEHENPRVAMPASAPVGVSHPESKPARNQANQNSLPVSTIPQTSIETEQKTVTAPIPGVIIAISVKEGEPVEIGQQLCVLEAMKMKNVIRSSRSGIIETIHISTGETVSHGQLLLDFAD